MSAIYTWDVFCSLDGFGSYNEKGDWGGYWGKQGPEFLERRLGLYGPQQRMVFGANTFREFVEMLGSSDEATGVGDPWVGQMRRLPTTVVSTSLSEPLDWPDATVATGDAVEVIGRMKKESDVPIRSHGSLSMNRALMAAGLVDLIQVSLFPVIAGNSGDQPIFGGAADFDLELVGQNTFDGRTQELMYRPTLHG